MKYNVLRLYISAFHPKALNVVDNDLAGLLAWLPLNTFPLILLKRNQQWYEDSAK